jgi:hypothetical protein
MRGLAQDEQQAPRDTGEGVGKGSGANESPTLHSKGVKNTLQY